MGTKSKLFAALDNLNTKTTYLSPVNPLFVPLSNPTVQNHIQNENLVGAWIYPKDQILVVSITKIIFMSTVIVTLGQPVTIELEHSQYPHQHWVRVNHLKHSKRIQTSIIGAIYEIKVHPLVLYNTLNQVL